MKRCPKCGCEEFFVGAHVVQEWKVDCNGDFMEVTEDCIEVAHFPDDEDLWYCASCGHSAAGEEFNI